MKDFLYAMARDKGYFEAAIHYLIRSLLTYWELDLFRLKMLKIERQV